MKKITLLFLLICVCLFSGCHSENNSISDVRLEPFSFSSSLNVFREEYGNLIPCGYRFDVPEDYYLPLTISAVVSPDKSMESTYIPMRIYVFGNGIPLDFCLPDVSTNSKFSKTYDLTIKKDEEFIFKIGVDLNIGDEISMLSILCDFYPENIPQKGLGAYAGCNIYSLMNSKIKQKPNVECVQGVFFNSDEKEFDIDIGKNSLSKNNSVITEHHFYDDVKVSSEDDNVYIKFNSGYETDFPFYIILFRDGVLIAPFDGCYSCCVDCKQGTKSFQYQIPMCFFETNGLHTFRAVALPAFGRVSDSKIEMSAYSTKKVRIQVSRGD